MRRAWAQRWVWWWYTLIPAWSAPLLVAAILAKAGNQPLYELRWYVQLGLLLAGQAYGISAFAVCLMLDRTTIAGLRKVAAYVLVLGCPVIGPTLGYYDVLAIWNRERAKDE